MDKKRTDDIVSDVAEEGYELYIKLFKALREEDSDNGDRMGLEETYTLAIALVPEAMRRLNMKQSIKQGEKRQ